MKEVKINIPDTVFTYWESEETLAKRMLFLIVLDLLRQKKISKGKAAEILGINTHDIFNLMSQYGIEAANYSVEELEKEWALWEKIKSATQ